MNPNQFPTTEAAAIAAIAQERQGPELRNETQIRLPYAIHKDGKIETLERMLDNPAAIIGRVELADAASFVDYTSRFAEPGTLIFCRESDYGAEFTAVFDYHQPQQPRRLMHAARLTLAFSDEWKRWDEMDTEMVPQAKMARFMEDNMLDLVNPSPAEMLEIVKTLEATQNVEFKSGLRLDNGDRELAYAVTSGARAGAQGSLTIPATICIRMPVFEGGAPTAVAARWRWNIDGGNLRLGYEIERPHKLIKAAILEMKIQIATALGRTILDGRAPINW